MTSSSVPAGESGRTPSSITERILARALFWIWRTRSFVTPMILPTSSSVRPGLFLLLPVEAAANHGLFNAGEVSKVAIDDGLEFINAIVLDLIPAPVGPIALLHFRFKFDRETGAMLGRFHGRAAERLENRPARIGAELEAAIDIEFVDGSQQGHVAFAHDFSEIDIAGACALSPSRGRCREVGPDEVFAEVLELAMPIEELLRLSKRERCRIDLLFEEPTGRLLVQ